MCTQPEALGANLEELDSVKTLRSLLLQVGLADREHLGLLRSVVHLKSLMNDCDRSFVKDLSSAPLHLVNLSCIVQHLGFNSPKWLRNKLLDLFSLVHTEAQSWSLARAVSQHSDTSSPDGVEEPVCLEAREGNANLEVKNLSSVHRYSLIVVWFVFQALKCCHDIFVCNRRELCSIYSLHSVRRSRYVLLANIKDLEADILAFLVAIKPKDNKIDVR